MLYIYESAYQGEVSVTSVLMINDDKRKQYNEISNKRDTKYVSTGNNNAEPTNKQLTKLATSPTSHITSINVCYVFFFTVIQKMLKIQVLEFTT